MLESCAHDLIDREQWNQLGSVLAICVPSYLGGAPIEFCIAARGDPMRLAVLCEAYSFARSEEARDALAECFRRAFPKYAFAALCDQRLVARCCDQLKDFIGRRINDKYPWILSGRRSPEAAAQSGEAGLFLPDE